MSKLTVRELIDALSYLKDLAEKAEEASGARSVI